VGGDAETPACAGRVRRAAKLSDPEPLGNDAFLMPDPPPLAMSFASGAPQLRGSE